MHVGFGRNLVLGDTLANVLAAAGYDVQREYYVNDAGTQMENFGESLYVRYCELLGRSRVRRAPERSQKGTTGASISSTGRERSSRPRGIASWTASPTRRPSRSCATPACAMAMEHIRHDCERMDIAL
jgi:arginyl-tRNA synthetase